MGTEKYFFVEILFWFFTFISLLFIYLLICSLAKANSSLLSSFHGMTHVKKFIILHFYFQDENPCPEERFQSICLDIKKHNLHEDLEDLILKQVQDELLNQVVPTFWSFFDKTKCNTNFEGFRSFTDGIFYLAKQLKLCMVHVKPINKLRSIAGYKRNLYGYDDIEVSFHVTLKAALLSKLPKDHDTVTSYFYKHSFNSFVHQNSNASPSKFTLLIIIIWEANKDERGKTRWM